MHITPSPQSLDYVNNKKQFQLQSLLTEQRHPKTNDLSYKIAQNTTAGLQALLSVDEDITAKLKEIADHPKALSQLEQASKAVQIALLKGHKIYFYGTGSTGRLAEAVESSLWRPFWGKAAKSSAGSKIDSRLPNVQNRLKGEITGGDRALISSLEGFEDLQLMGKLQLIDNKIQKEDVVFEFTEGGETSAGIGAVLAAAKLYDNQPTQNIYFGYNNPDSVLMPFDRSRAVLENPLITKLNLATGPQALSGSTRMQATTIGLYVSGIILEQAIYHILKDILSPTEMTALGFKNPVVLKQRLLDFAQIQNSIYQSADQIAAWTDLEAETYIAHHKSTYLAEKALLPVFVDVTERAPTFRLAPLDMINAKEKHSWIQVWSTAESSQKAWDMLLGRPFHGLDPEFYQQPFSTQIDDPYLQKIALASLTKAGFLQQNLYDLSFSEHNIRENGPAIDDLGAAILISGETVNAQFQKFFKLFANAKANLVLVAVADKSLSDEEVQDFKKLPTKTVFISVVVPQQDPFGLNQIIGLKMLLNAHSTGVMAKIERIVGNTMTYVQPGNLKLVGRATYLIQMQVNAVISHPKWIEACGNTSPITYAEANAILFDSIDYMQKTGQYAPESPEVALSIICALESLKHRQDISWEQAQAILKTGSLNLYLAAWNA